MEQHILSANNIYNLRKTRKLQEIVDPKAILIFKNKNYSTLLCTNLILIKFKVSARNQTLVS